MKEGLVQYERLINVKGIKGLNDIHQDNGSIRMGALCTHRQLETAPILKQHLTALSKLEENVANVRVRQAGTIGGNVCFAEPHADPGTLLIALNARMIAEKRGGKREIAAETFFVDAYETALQPDEVLTEIVVPIPPKPSGSCYMMGKPLAEAKGEITYGASFVKSSPRRRDTSTARSYRDISRTSGSSSFASRQACGRHHAVELPHRDDHAQGRAGTGGRLPWSSSPPDRRRYRRWRWRSWHSARACRRVCSTWSRPTFALVRDRQGDARERHRAGTSLHRLDPGGPHPDAAVRTDDQEAVAGAWWQRAFIVFDDADLDARSKARWPASTATPARPACAPTASTCRTASTTPSSPGCRRRPAR